MTKLNFRKEYFFERELATLINDKKIALFYSNRV